MARQSRIRAPLAVLAASMACTGCGLGIIDADSGGADNLPTQGAGPYGKPGVDFDTPADEPYVLTINRVHLRDPSVSLRAGGGFALWFGYEDLDTATGEIWYAELASITDLPERGPEPALAPDQPWEQGWVGAPAVVRGATGGLVMYYQGGLEDPHIGRATSEDGVSWQKHPDNPLVAGAEPSVGALPDGGFALFYTRPDEPGIWAADSPDGIAWTERAAPVVTPRPDEDDAFDRDAVSDPHIVIRRTAAGRTHHGLFYNGARADGDETEIAVGWAGSFDGVAWERFVPDAPVLEEGGVSEHGPTVALEPDRGVMFFHEPRQGTDRIATATHP